MNRLGFVLSAIAAAQLLGCSPRASGRDVRRTLIEDLGTQYWLANYAEFEKRLSTLKSKSQALCQEATDDSLAAAQKAWWDARAPWKRNEMLAFGPTVDEPVRAGPKIDFWPARTEDIDALLASETNLDADTIGTLGTNVRGLPVLEYLLYGATGAPSENFDPTGRRCAYLLAATDDTRTQAGLLHDAWDPEGGDYLGNLANSGRYGSAYPSIEAALSEIVSRLAFVIENARGDKLAAVLGTRTGGEPQPGLAESPWSARSIEDIQDNLRGVEEVLLGDGEESASLGAYLISLKHAELVDQLREAIQAARSALDAIPEPLTEAVVEDPDSVTLAIDALGEVQTLIQVDVVNTLGLTLTWNDADGD